MSQNSSASKEVAPDAALREPDSRQQPVWHVIVLGIFASPVLYIAYWTYRVCRDLKRESHFINGAPENPAAVAAGIKPAKPAPLPRRKQNVRLDEHFRDALAVFGRMSPGLRGLGSLVPFLNVYLWTTISLGICHLVPDEQSLPRRNPLLATGLVVGGYLLLLALGRLPGMFFMASLLAMVPIAVAQHWLNKYWAHVEADDVLVRHGFSIGEMLVIIAGAMVLGLVTAGFMIGVK